MLIIGIDPGVSGGVAIIPLYSFAETTIYPLEHYPLPKLVSIFKDIRYGTQDISSSSDTEYRKDTQEYQRDTQVEVFLEEPQLPMTNFSKPGAPRNFNVQAHKKLARSLGQLEGICIALNWNVTLLSPRKWQNALDCSTGGDKNVTKNLAQGIFHFLTKKTGDHSITHGTADALLIALYGYLQYATIVPRRVSLLIDTPLTKRSLIHTNPVTTKVPPPPFTPISRTPPR